jgi:glycosyltransferase involved in cell wall biosynthesis
LSDRDLQHQIRTAALVRCQEDLNWSNIAAQTLEVYRKAIEIKGSSLNIKG